MEQRIDTFFHFSDLYQFQEKFEQQKRNGPSSTKEPQSEERETSLGLEIDHRRSRRTKNDKEAEFLSPPSSHVILKQINLIKVDFDLLPYNRKLYRLQRGRFLTKFGNIMSRDDLTGSEAENNSERANNHGGNPSHHHRKRKSRANTATMQDPPEYYYREPRGSRAGGDFRLGGGNEYGGTTLPPPPPTSMARVSLMDANASISTSIAGGGGPPTGGIPVYSLQGQHDQLEREPRRYGGAAGSNAAGDQLVRNRSGGTSKESRRNPTILRKSKEIASFMRTL